MKEHVKAEVAAALPIEDPEGDGGGQGGAGGAAFDRESMVRVDPEGVYRDAEQFDDEPEEETTGTRPKTSKLKVLGAVAGFALGLLLLATGVSWFFGMGAFAQAKRQNVDRTPKQGNGMTAPAATEDEKLRMALNMVAEKAAASAPSPSPVSVANQKPGSISPNEKGPEPPSLILPGETVPSASSTVRAEKSPVPPSSSGGGSGSGSMRTTPVTRSSISAPSRTEAPRVREAEPTAVTPIYFGPSADTEEEGPKPNTPNPAERPRDPVTSTQSFQLPFGTFLPVRILGAIYAVQNSGSLVRMELTQAVETGTEGVELPAGTVVVGRVKGSELNRILVRVIGLIDPSTGGLVSFDGELIGGDGAAGIAGKRRSVKSGWSKLLTGLREAGSTAIGALSGIRRGGGTVVIADRAAGSMGADVAEIIRRDRVSEYVEVTAGTSAFVLVTELPREVSETFRASSAGVK